MLTKAVVVVDTREKEPYSFELGLVDTLRQALPAGDYSLLGYENTIAIERKSLEDYVNTLIRGRERFNIELQRLRGYEFACIVVEASLTDLLSGGYRSGAHPNAIVGSTISIIADYCVPVYFCTNRQAACLFVQELLLRLHRKVISRCPEPSPEPIQS